MYSMYSVEYKLCGAKEPMEKVSMSSISSVENKLCGAEEPKERNPLFAPYPS